MAESNTTRLDLRRWSAAGDTPGRDEFDHAHAQLEALAAGYREGTAALRPAAAAALEGFWYYATDTGALSYCDGVAWIAIPQPSSATPAVTTAAGSAGAGSTYSRSDHAHPAPTLRVLSDVDDTVPGAGTEGYIIRWRNASGAFILEAFPAVGAATSAEKIDSAAATDWVAAIRRAGDTNHRVELREAGLAWGPGNAALDLLLKRFDTNTGAFKNAGDTLYKTLIVDDLAVQTKIRDLADSAINMRWGSGSPEGSVTAGIGSKYSDKTTGVQYQKVTGTGNTGWVAQSALGHTHETLYARVYDDIAATTQIVSSIAETDLYRKTLVAADMHVGDRFRLRALGDLNNNTGAPQTVILRLYFGATVVLLSPAISFAASANRREWVLDVEIAIQNANAQRGGGMFSAGQGTADNWEVSQQVLVGYGTAALAISSNRDVALTATLGANNAALDIRLHTATLEQLP